MLYSNIVLLYNVNVNSFVLSVFFQNNKIRHYVVSPGAGHTVVDFGEGTEGEISAGINKIECSPII